MVIKKEKKYQCEECKLWYKDKSWAEKCEVWCKHYQSCNIEIVNHGMKR